MSEVPMFDTKIAIVVRNDLATWQKLNVTAFLTSGVIGQNPELIGQPYADADNNAYHPLLIQPVIVLVADASMMRKIYERAMRRDTKLAIYTEDMFRTGHDEANRAAVSCVSSADLKLVGLALRNEKKLVDKITKGAKMHP